jgi:hypothetical protein
MATFTAPFMRESITEVLPEALRMSSLTKSSILTGRRRIRVIPQTGQTYGGSGNPNVCNILIQDSAGLLDMQSVVLSFNVQTSNTAIGEFVANRGANDVYLSSPSGVTGNGAAMFRPTAADPAVTAVLDDFAWSVFQRVTISLNSQLVDDLNHVGRQATTEVYASASPSWYNTIGTVMGAWKFTDQTPLSGVAISQVGALINAGAIVGSSTVNFAATVSYPIKAAIGRSGIVYDSVKAPVTASGGNYSVTPPTTAGFAYSNFFGSQPGASAIASAALYPNSRSSVHTKLYRASKWFKDVFFASAGLGGIEPLRDVLPVVREPQYATPTFGVANEVVPGGLALVNDGTAPGLQEYAVKAVQRSIVGAYQCLTGASLYQPMTSQWVAATSSGSGSAGNKFSIPMGLLSHLFRQEALFPLRNAGQLVIQIQFQPPANCMYGGGYSIGDAPDPNAAPALSLTSTGLSYVVSDMEVECDIVTAVPEYTAILDQVCSRPADQGLAIAFDAILTSQQQVSGSSSSPPNTGLGQQTYTLIASKGSENVRSFHATFSPTAGVSSGRHLPLSTYPCYNTQQWQIRVGSVYYPAFPSKGLSKNFMELLSSMNAPMPSIGQSTICNYDMFRSSTPTATWVAAANVSLLAAPGQNLYGVLNSAFSATTPLGPGVNVQNDPSLDWMSDCYIIGYCFDNLKHAESLSHDGLDTRAIAGGMLQLDFTCSPLEAFQVYFHIRFTRTIVLADNGVSVVG